MEAKDSAKLENDARTALIQAIVGGVLLLGFLATAIGLVLTWRNLQITQNSALRNLQLTQDRQITEHYTRAIEHLGSDKLEVRLGAIYALERIARDSERDHWPIMEILTAYVREHAPWKEAEQLSKEEISPSETQPTQNHQSLPKPTTDIQAVLTVLGRRTRTYGKGEDQRLNLSRTNLRGASLESAQLQGANLWNAQLQGVSLNGAQLQGAILWKAQLQGAILSRAELREATLVGAQLQGTDLREVQLQEANLFNAQLQGANLWNAQLQGADLMFAQLAGARNLTIEQLSTVETMYEAVLDAPLREQIEQQFSHHRYRCRFCHLVLDAWVPTAKAVDEGLVLDHLAQGCDSDHAYLYLKRVQTEGIATVAAQAFEIVKERQAHERLC